MGENVLLKTLVESNIFKCSTTFRETKHIFVAAPEVDRQQQSQDVNRETEEPTAKRTRCDDASSGSDN